MTAGTGAGRRRRFGDLARAVSSAITRGDALPALTAAVARLGADVAGAIWRVGRAGPMPLATADAGMPGMGGCGLDDRLASARPGPR